MKTFKIWTQNDFRMGKVRPMPGVFFLADDQNYYKLVRQHPNLKADEFGIKYTDRIIPEGEEKLHPEDFWLAIPLHDREVAALVRGERT